jgi:hypothetical protein
VKSEPQPSELPVRYLKLIEYSHHDPESHDATLLEVLITSPRFYERLTTARKSIGISEARNDQVGAYLSSHRFSYTGLPVLLAMLAGAKELALVAQGANRVRKELNLPERWSEPLQLSILADYIALPPHGNLELELRGVRATTKAIAGRGREGYVLAKDQSLEITIKVPEATTPRQLTDFVAHNVDIRRALNAVTTSTRTRMQPDALAIRWGVEVLKAKREGDKSFGAISQDLVEKYEGTDELVPDGNDLAKLFKRYMEILPSTLH